MTSCLRGVCGGGGAADWVALPLPKRGCLRGGGGEGQQIRGRAEGTEQGAVGRDHEKPMLDGSLIA